MNTYILLFLLISFGYSLYEKLKDKKGYTIFLENHLKQKKWSSLFWWLLVLINSSVFIFLSIGIFQVFLQQNFLPLKCIYEYNAVAIIVLLFGQRMAGDYQGAANLGIYFLIVIFGEYINSLS